MNLERLTTVLLVAWLLVLATAGTLGNFYIAGWALLSMLAAAPLLLTPQLARAPAVATTRR